ncbi:type II RES/Xre toxin-antitoxin system antitoxin [Dyadobacter arcticus]|uniref:Toxin-antitoxin system antitoxin component (TIGR02293 family) n=1 Tax=Dyadobacter arcticus TaxID=1078754 RepID=A0ABX0UKR0_9BACT|nr:antitoxin Xre/MbcA/ParS toxin-binding domain-containing protein [Dyadobacter arcticus]NIJ53546.1 putative toxin-antitoxin system antitoxin component (TIGR02293 family) [Dyadobacter arcticus]
MKKHTQKLYPSPEDEDASPKILSEPPVAYYGTVPSLIFSSSALKSESQMTGFEKMTIARQGISKTDFERFKDKTGLDYDQLAAALSVARATLINKKGTEKFNPSVSEKIVSIADIYSYGYEVFEDVKRFNQWIFRANHALGGKSPFEILDSQFGREEVRNLIGRIDYGVYS